MRFAEFWKLCSFLSPIESFWCWSFQVLRQTADGSTDPLFPRPYPHCLAFGVSWWEKILKLMPGVKNMHHLMSYMEGIYIVHQSFIWPLRMFYQFWRVNFLSTFYKGWVSMHLRFCKGCNLAQKMSFSNLPCLPFRTVEPGWDPRGKKPDISTSPVPWTEHLWTILNWGWLQPRNQHSKATNRVIPSWTVLSLETQNLMDISWALETWFFLLSFFEFVCKSSMIYCESVIYFFS